MGKKTKGLPRTARTRSGKYKPRQLHKAVVRPDVRHVHQARSRQPKRISAPVQMPLQESAKERHRRRARERKRRISRQKKIEQEAVEARELASIRVQLLTEHGKAAEASAGIKRTASEAIAHRLECRKAAGFYERTLKAANHIGTCGRAFSCDQSDCSISQILASLHFQFAL